MARAPKAARLSTVLSREEPTNIFQTHEPRTVAPVAMQSQPPHLLGVPSPSLSRILKKSERAMQSKRSHQSGSLAQSLM